MAEYANLTKEELLAKKGALTQQYQALKALGRKLDMSRGRPSIAQLDDSNDMLDVLNSRTNLISKDGIDVRNYGDLDGIPECKELFAGLLNVRPSQIIVGGNSSLQLMYDAIAKAYCFGVLGSERPWCKEEKLKFLCPVPGYDRHFAITEEFGFEMINVPMTDEGPDMDMVERLVQDDAAIKGIWCVPVYSNPDGIVYSDETVRRMAALKPAAKDFRIFWDNAYFLHHLYEDCQASIPNIIEECQKAGNPNMVYEFMSTSKVTFAGGGVSVMASSEENIAFLKKQLAVQTISNDKINQLRHVLYLKNAQGVKEHMKNHANSLRPKFEVVQNALQTHLAGKGIGTWRNPKGGYFVSFFALNGCAAKIVKLCKEAGLVMTGAGAAYPYGKDPSDSNIRISPSAPTVEELSAAMELFCVCVELASVEKLLEEK